MKYDELALIRLFTDKEIKEYTIKDLSHGEKDFRETIFVTDQNGLRYIVKVACNTFTTEESVGMWQRCAEEYRLQGYYCPRILTDINGRFPKVNYKGYECVAYAEEYSLYKTAEDFVGEKRFREELYIMTARIAAKRYDYTDIPSAYSLFDLFAGDEMDEVEQNAMDFRSYCETLPECFIKQAKEIFNRWEDNRKELEKVYHKLPFSVFQADFNDSNVLLDKDGKFVGICDFNLAGRDEFLNYLFREIYRGSFEEELSEILRALKIASDYYRFSNDEIEAAPLIYRCVKPLWYTRVQVLKEAKDDRKAIQACLDAMENAQIKEIDFEKYMR